MDIHRELIDAPLETPTPIKQKRSIVTNIDFGINAFLFIVTVLIGIATIFNRNIGLAFLVSLFFLGSYQLLSALVAGIRGNRQKLLYLGGALLYLLLLGISIDVMDQVFRGGGALEIIAVATIWAVIPLLGALYYIKLCYQSLKPE